MRRFAQTLFATGNIQGLIIAMILVFFMNEPLAAGTFRYRIVASLDVSVQSGYNKFVTDPESGKSVSVVRAHQKATEPQRITNAEKLGFPKGTKVLLLHMDDLGMCEEANQAGMNYIANGHILSGAVMMPCEFAVPFVEWVKNVPNADIGVHLTLTSEWKSWRWPTVSPAESVPGLLDPEGKMWRSVPEVVMHATPREIETEIRAQIEKMLSLGLRPTHIDTHMGTLYGSPAYVRVFLKVAQEYRIPANAIDLSNPKVADFYRSAGYPINDEVIQMLAEYSLPRLDNFGSVPEGKSYEEVKSGFMEMLKALEPGLTEIIFHPSFETGNLKTITGTWQQRVWEAQIFSDPEIHRFFKDNNIQITSWREIMQRHDNL